MLRNGLLILSVLSLSALPMRAHAQEAGATADPMAAEMPDDNFGSDAFSVRGGRLLGGGEMALAAGAGWPGIFAELVIGASSGFNLGPRVDFLYATPLLGGSVGVGAEFSLPMRIHVHSVEQHNIDIALVVRPFFLLGRGALVGGRGIFDDDLGMGFGAVIGARAGWQFSDKLNFIAGFDTTFAYVTIPDSTDNGQFIGLFTAVVGIEWAMQRDIILFAEGHVGGGFADDFYFSGRYTTRFYGGISFLF